MARTAACDRCNASMKEGDGYSFFSMVSVQQIGLKEIGAMLLCEECTRKVINPANWQLTKNDSYLAEMALYDAGMELIEAREKGLDASAMRAHQLGLSEALRRANDISIVLNCKDRDLSPAQAKAKARELAQNWWHDRKAGEMESRAFWTSLVKKQKTDAAPARRKFGCLIGCGIAVFLLGGGCVGISFVAVVLMEQEKTGVRAEAQEALRLLADGKTTEAYAATALAYRSEANEAAFIDVVKALDVKGHTGWEEKDIRHNRAPETGWTVEGYVTGPGTRVTPVTMAFVWESNAWKLRSIRKSD